MRELKDVRVVICICMWDNLKPQTVMDLLMLMGDRYGRGTTMWHDGEERSRMGTKDEATFLVGQLFCVGSLIHFSRNRLVRMAYEKFPNFTHVLFIDSDMCGFDADTIRALVLRNVDIVTPLMTQRAPPFDVCAAPIIHNDPDKLQTKVSDIFDMMGDPESDGMLEVYHTGTAFMLIRREVLDSLREETKDWGSIWFTMDRIPGPETYREAKEWMHNELKKEIPDDMSPKAASERLAELLIQSFERGLNAHHGKAIMGEDVIFCRRAGLMGYASWLDTRLSVQHIGDRPYDVQTKLDAIQAEKDKVAALGAPIGRVGRSPKLPPIRTAA